MLSSHHATCPRMLVTGQAQGFLLTVNHSPQPPTRLQQTVLTRAALPDLSVLIRTCSKSGTVSGMKTFFPWSLQASTLASFVGAFFSPWWNEIKSGDVLGSSKRRRKSNPAPVGGLGNWWANLSRLPWPLTFLYLKWQQMPQNEQGFLVSFVTQRHPCWISEGSIWLSVIHFSKRFWKSDLTNG